MSCDWNVEGVPANNSSNPAKLKYKSMMEPQNFFYIHWLMMLLIPKAMGLTLNFYLKEFQQSEPQRSSNWIDLS
jgi:hypothetical protein